MPILGKSDLLNRRVTRMPRAESTSLQQLMANDEPNSPTMACVTLDTTPYAMAEDRPCFTYTVQGGQPVRNKRIRMTLTTKSGKYGA